MRYANSNPNASIARNPNSVASFVDNDRDDDRDDEAWLVFRRGWPGIRC